MSWTSPDSSRGGLQRATNKDTIPCAHIKSAPQGPARSAAADHADFKSLVALTDSRYSALQGTVGSAAVVHAEFSLAAHTDCRYSDLDRAPQGTARSAAADRAEF